MVVSYEPMPGFLFVPSGIRANWYPPPSSGFTVITFYHPRGSVSGAGQSEPPQILVPQCPVRARGRDVSGEGSTSRASLRTEES
jgi:hypothetical protein